MNFQNMTFLEISRLSSTLNKPSEINDMLSVLDEIDRNMKIIRTMLKGKREAFLKKEKEERKRRLTVVSQDE